MSGPSGILQTALDFTKASNIVQTATIQRRPNNIATTPATRRSFSVLCCLEPKVTQQLLPEPSAPSSAAVGSPLENVTQQLLAPSLLEVGAAPVPFSFSRRSLPIVSSSCSIRLCKLITTASLSVALPITEGAKDLCWSRGSVVGVVWVGVASLVSSRLWEEWNDGGGELGTPVR